MPCPFWIWFDGPFCVAALLMIVGGRHACIARASAVCVMTIVADRLHAWRIFGPFVFQALRSQCSLNMLAMFSFARIVLSFAFLCQCSLLAVVRTPFAHKVFLRHRGEEGSVRVLQLNDTLVGDVVVCKSRRCVLHIHGIYVRFFVFSQGVSRCAHRTHHSEELLVSHRSHNKVAETVVDSRRRSSTVMVVLKWSIRLLVPALLCANRRLSF